MDMNNYKPTNQTSNKYKNYKLSSNQQDKHTYKNSTQKQVKQISQYNSPHIGSYHSNTNPSYQDEVQYANQNQIKAENAKLKRLLKESQAKRIQITKQCSQLSNKYQKLQEQNMQLHRKIKDIQNVGEGQKFRYEQLKFLNKQLYVEIQQLQKQNQILNEKLKRHTDILEKKYEELQQRTYKRIEQALKRIKKSIHYLSSLSPKQIEKTKEIQIQNLNKAAEVLKGKYSQNSKFQQQIEELMNPIRNIQEELHQKIKQNGVLKQENNRLIHQVKKHKKIDKQLLPQYKQAIEKLKKNLVQVRMQLTQNQYDKCQVKKKYEEKIKQVEIKYEQLFKQHRKLRLENKIFEKKIQEMQDDVQEEKQRLMGENQLLKKLYKSEDRQKSKRDVQRDLGLEEFAEYERHQSDSERQNQEQVFSYKTTANQFRKNTQGSGERNNTIQNKQYGDQFKKVKKGQKFLKKNYSASQLASADKQYKQTYAPKNILNQRLRFRENPTNPSNLAHSRQSDSENYNKYNHLRLNQEKPNRNYKITKNEKLQISAYYQNKQNQYKKQHNQQDYQYQHQKQIEQHNNQQGRSELQNQYRQGSSEMSASQDGLKNQIFKIDQQIMEIQKTLDRQLNMYK